MVAWKQIEQSSAAREKCSEGAAHIHTAGSDGRYPECAEHVFIPRLAPPLPSLGVSSFTLSIHLSSLSAVHLLLSLSLSLSATGHTWNSWGGWRSRFPWQAGAVKKSKKTKKQNTFHPLIFLQSLFSHHAERFALLVVTFAATEVAERTLHVCFGGVFLFNV